MDYYLFIISNQPDISKGHIEEGTTEKINKILYNTFPIKEIYICPHQDYHNCNCRKPSPGMIKELAAKWNIDLTKSFLIGDNWKDIDAGNNAGCKSILIDKIYNKKVLSDYRAKNLDGAVSYIKKTELLNFDDC